MLAAEEVSEAVAAMARNSFGGWGFGIGEEKTGAL
jgi:N-acetylglucosamine kinase-like BadF-type ATPase